MISRTNSGKGQGYLEPPHTRACVQFSKRATTQPVGNNGSCVSLIFPIASKNVTLGILYKGRPSALHAQKDPPSALSQKVAKGQSGAEKAGKKCRCREGGKKERESWPNCRA